MTDFANLVIKADSTQVKSATTDIGLLGAASGRLTGALRAMLPALTAVLSVRALGRMADEARDFGAAIGEVSTLLDDMDQLPRIEREARMLASTFGGSPTAQVQAFYQAISAGASSAEEATSILTTANKLAIGGVTDIGTAVDGLTTIINSFGLEANQAGEVSDAMFVAMRAGKTTIGELSDSIGKSAALAASTGVSYEELLAATAALTAGGLSTSESINGVKASLSNILKPSEDAKKAAEEMGIQFDLAALQSQGLQGFMEGVTEAADGNQQQLVNLFGSVEALNTVLALTGGSAEAFTEIMEEMERRTGMSDTAFGKIADTMDFKLTLISGKIASTRIIIGEFLLGLAEPMVDQIAGNFDTYVLFLSNVIRATVIAATNISQAFAPVWEVFRVGFETIGGWVADLYNFASEKFSDLGVDGLKLSEILAIGFGNVVNGLKAGIQANTIEVAAFFDKVGFWMRWAVGKANESGNELAAIDKARVDSLAAVEQSYLNANTALADGLIQTRLTAGGFTLLNTEVGTVSTSTNTWAAGLNALADNLAGSVGGSVTSAASDTGEAIGALNTTVGEGTTAVGEMTSALGESEDEGLAASLKLQETMLLNIQTEWGNLIYDLLDDGKVNFKSFFNSVIDGFKRMIAEMAAADLANAVFGGGGLGALTNGTLVNTIKRGASSVLGAVGIGGGAAGSAAGVSGIVGGMASAGAAGTASGVSGIAGGMASNGAAVAGASGGGFLASAGSAIASGASSIASGVGGLISAIPGWGWALGGAALLANVLDDSGTMSSNAGMLTQDLGHEGSFKLDPFASGAQFTGFSRRSGEQEAGKNINAFSQLDAALSQAYEAATGSRVSLNASDFIGYDEKGEGRGAFFGAASEDGGSNGTPIGAQLDKYASRWIQLAGQSGGIPQSVIDSVIGSGDAGGIIDRAGAVSSRGISGDTTGVASSPSDGSHAQGIDRVPFNGYRAILHEGERVQTKQEVLANDSGTSDNGGLIYTALVSILTYLIKTFDIVDRWNANGIPEERTAP